MLLPMSAVGLRVVMYFSLLWRCCGTLSSLYGRGHCLHKDDDSYNGQWQTAWVCPDSGRILVSAQHCALCGPLALKKCSALQILDLRHNALGSDDLDALFALRELALRLLSGRRRRQPRRAWRTAARRRP